MVTVRLPALAEITGRSAEMLRQMTLHNQLPWPSDEFTGPGHRRFNGRHALALVLVEMLTKFGARLADAADAVRGSWHVIERFTDDLEAERDPGNRFAAALVTAVEHSVTGPAARASDLLTTGTAEELLDILKGCMDNAGRVSDRGNGATLRNLGAVSFVAASLSEGYRLLAIRAAAAGYQVHGRTILPHANETGGNS